MKHLVTRVSQGLRRRLRQERNNWHLESTARRVSRLAPAPQGQPVIVFNASTRLAGMSQNAAYSLLTSWGLRLAGVPVIHFLCQGGMSRCVLGTDRRDAKALPPCPACLAQSRHQYAGAQIYAFTYSIDPAVEQALAELNLAGLENFTWQGVPLGELTLPSLRWALRRHHLAQDENTLFFYRQYILSAWRIAQEFEKLIREAQPRAVVVFNGIQYPEATARWVAQRAGLRVISHEVCHQPLTAFFTDGEATAYPIHIPAEYSLSPQEEKELDLYLEQRFQGNFSMAGIRFWPEMRRLDENFLQRAASFRQIVPIFTNVIFDTSQKHANVVFPHMFTWLDQVLELIRAHPETLFVLRAHPDESRRGKESQESVAQWVAQRGVEALPNVIFVRSEEYFSSYELIQRSKFVLVYNSTIGLEAALMGAVVLCAGRARYTQVPTVFFPESMQEYRQKAEEFLTAPTLTAPPEFRQNARRFMAYNLNVACLPFANLLEPDGVWPGFVRLKNVDPSAYAPASSPVLDIIVKGILEGSPFLR